MIFCGNFIDVKFSSEFFVFENNLKVLWPNHFRVKIDIERAQMFWSLQGILVKKEIFREICDWIDKSIFLLIKTDWKTQIVKITRDRTSRGIRNLGCIYGKHLKLHNCWGVVIVHV